MAVRHATEEDLSALLQLNSTEIWQDPFYWKSIDQQQRWEDGMWWADPELLAWYYSVLQATGGGILVVESDDEIIGELDYVQSYDDITGFSGNRLHIIWLLTHPDYRQQGIAQQLLQFLSSSTDLPIWVEPEDNRSDALYQKFGKQVFSISNWQLDIHDMPASLPDDRLEYNVLSLESVLELSSSYSLLLGRYYAPNYDSLQLTMSDPVYAYMWGNTRKPEVFEYQLTTTNVYAIMTQYPRIWVNHGYDPQELQRILGAISLTLFEQGFDKIYIQLYNHPTLSKILQNLHYICTIADDPVYQLYPL